MYKLKVNDNNHKLYLMLGFLIITVSYLAISIIFQYEDVQSYTVWSVEFWDVLFSHKGLGSYYEYAFENVRGAYHGAPAGSYLTFFPWIIWNLPIYLLNRNVSNNILTTACTTWTKMFLLVCVAVIALYVFKILRDVLNIDMEGALCAALLVAGSLEVLDSTAYAGQDEVVYLACFMICMYSCFKGKKICSLIWAGICVTICPIMVIPFLILLVCYEKRIWVIVVNTVLVFVPTVLFEIVYRSDEIYAEVKGFNTLGTFQLMMNTGTLDTALGRVSIAAVLLIFIAFISYFDVVTYENKEIKSVEFITYTLLCMSFLMASTFYRSCIYVPFLALFIFLNEKNRNMKILLFMVIAVSRFGVFLSNLYNYNLGYVSPFAVRVISSAADKGSVVNVANPIVDSLIYILRAAAFGGVGIILYIQKLKKELELKLSINVLMMLNCALGTVWTLVVLIACLR